MQEHITKFKTTWESQSYAEIPLQQSRLMSDDLESMLDSLMFSIEAHYVAGEHAKSRRKS